MNDDDLNDGHFHEALDRAYMLAQVWEQYVLNAPAVQATPALREIAATACTAMNDCYQAIGQVDPKRGGG